ncbi:MAG: DUF1016 N-terminal domain-containing protein [Syntrophorhabdales bacterium]
MPRPPGSVSSTSEQAGARRAEYGKEVLRTLSKRLMNEFGQGFSKRNLECMRRFYLFYRERLSQIAQTPSAQLPVQVQGRETGKITQTPSGMAMGSNLFLICPLPSREGLRGIWDVLKVGLDTPCQ